MSNPEYQSLIRCTGEEARGRLILPASDPQGVARAIQDVPDDDLPMLLSDLGGHDLAELSAAFAQAKARTDAPTVVFAYTIKGWGLPIAGHPMNHSALLTEPQMNELQEQLGVANGAEWDRLPEDSIEGQVCRAAAERLRGIDDQIPGPLVAATQIPASLGVRHMPRSATQEALGRLLTEL